MRQKLYNKQLPCKRPVFILKTEVKIAGIPNAKLISNFPIHYTIHLCVFLHKQEKKIPKYSSKYKTVAVIKNLFQGIHSFL